MERLIKNLQAGERLARSGRRVVSVTPYFCSGGWIQVRFDDGTHMSAQDSERVTIWQAQEASC